MMAFVVKLTPAQRRKLASLTNGWREEPDDWRAGRVFLDLADAGLCEMREQRVKGGDVTTGPGNTSVYRWFTRRTPAGVAALADELQSPIAPRGPQGN